MHRPRQGGLSRGSTDLRYTNEQNVHALKRIKLSSCSKCLPLFAFPLTAPVLAKNIAEPDRGQTLLALTQAVPYTDIDAVVFGAKQGGASRHMWGYLRLVA